VTREEAAGDLIPRAFNLFPASAILPFLQARASSSSKHDRSCPEFGEREREGTNTDHSKSNPRCSGRARPCLWDLFLQRRKAPAAAVVITPNSCQQHHHAPATRIAPVPFTNKVVFAHLPAYNSAYNLVSSSAAFIIPVPSSSKLLSHHLVFNLNTSHFISLLQDCLCRLTSLNGRGSIPPYRELDLPQFFLSTPPLCDQLLAVSVPVGPLSCRLLSLDFAPVLLQQTVEVSFVIFSAFDAAPRVTQCFLWSYRGLCQQPFSLPDCSRSQTDAANLKNPPLSLSSRNFFDYCRSLRSPSLSSIEVWPRQLVAIYQTNGSLQLYRPRPSPDAWSICQRRIFPRTSQHFDQQSGDRYVSNPQTACV
jgi:hypothetical protein